MKSQIFASRILKISKKHFNLSLQNFVTFQYLMQIFELIEIIYKIIYKNQCISGKTSGKKSSLERLSRIVDSIAADEDEGVAEGSGSEPSAL